MQRLRLTALGVTVLWPVLAAGGFSVRSQTVFIAFAIGLLAVVLSSSTDGLAAACRQPVVVALMMAGLLSLISVAWTIGSEGDALRAGLLCFAYAVVLVTALLAARDGGSGALAAGLALVAFGEAVLGLLAVVTHSLPEAERLAGVWRPGGTFEYQPALALLQVGALPVLMSYLSRQEWWLRVAGAVGAVLAGATLALAGDRLAIGLATVLIVALVMMSRGDPRRLRATLRLAALLVAAGVVAVLTIERTVSVGAPEPGVVALLPLLGIVLVAGTLAAKPDRSSLPFGEAPLLRAAAAVIALAAVIAGVLLIASLGGSGSAHTAGLLHGRLEEWRAALQTWQQRPLVGSGSGTYLLASESHQTVAISRFAHDLPLEWAVELGLPGLIIALVLYFTVGRALLAQMRKPDALLFFPFVLAFMLSNLVDWVWHIPGMTVLWAVALGALLGPVSVVSRAAESTQPGTARRSGGPPPRR
jgi:O-antigen ligase